ncbi:MarR family transcriptional regulator (plasmid) [Haloferax mediterranei ATCC 33500]|uniref:MarR family regulator n=1 Tax=Haloferax mediterranei (strain ATCC 33500 / DSM 1411 / JCM 8866 / NBRC 14739 / NCIMB 2177 / R-4) TaxID=523841 RepID=I3RBC2_HALMT|nr:MarR family transcriptional regulator [Haloferax mediterranei]AFK21532.1 MarR family regulator [Haloferax mediterranei ATCC 33500]AHZ24415.1 MarR family transcriptional regulator [Haloferax mediterranei ATCC 33500]ELZ97155.1 MarR family regulator [Haloferax mediterranei ATCC 33500]MDX5990101.1 MarR family transcriptional regulator [Haloferax mediterranei ATCC 33500]QCQ76814.1 MarR family transcriptional regulator [Haloferax mediterranei ATCC 33500]
MDFRDFQNVNLFSAVIFVAATLTLTVQLLSPSPVVVSLGENGTQTTQIGQYFTYSEVAIVVVAAVLCGASGAYLVLHDRSNGPSKRPTNSDYIHTQLMPNDEKESLTETNRKRWEDTAGRLKNNEETIYTAVLEADGEIAQRDLVEETDLSKATVSRTLDKLENRNLVERKRNGMGNNVHLR